MELSSFSWILLAHFLIRFRALYEPLLIAYTAISSEAGTDSPVPVRGHGSERAGSEAAMRPERSSIILNKFCHRH